MATPRQPKPDSTPDPFVTPGGGGVSVDKAYEIVQRLSSIEKSMTYLEGMTSDTKQKVDTLITEVAAAKGSLRVVKWAMGIAGTLCVLLWGFLATIVTMAVKHYLHW